MEQEVGHRETEVHAGVQVWGGEAGQGIVGCRTPCRPCWFAGI